MTLLEKGIDEPSGATIWECDVCGERYGSITGSTRPTECTRCKEREYMVTMKQRVHEAQRVAILLSTAVLKHKSIVDEQYEASDADKELWKLLEELEIPNDSPSGVVAIIQ